MDEGELQALLTPESLPGPLDPAPVLLRGRRVHRRRRAVRALASGAALILVGATVGSALTGQATAPAPDVLAADAAPSSAPTATRQSRPPVSGDAEAVPACMRAVEQTGEAVDRSVDGGLVSLPGGWSVTVVTVSGQSIDCDITPDGTAAIVPSPPAGQGGVRERLGLQHLACRAAEPGLLAVTGGAPDADEQAGVALAGALPHLDDANARAVAEPFRPQGPVAELKAIYRFCLDNGWGGNRALLGP